MAILIKSGTIITAADRFEADILIEGERISQIGVNLEVSPDTEIIDAKGKMVLPGGVDVHTHFDLAMAGTVSSDDHYTGHKAAAFGGTTTVIDFINQDKNPLLANVEAMRKKVEPKAAVDYSFHMNISHLNAQVEKDIPLLVKEGITTLKVFTAYNKRLRLQDANIFRVLRIARREGMLVMAHCENGDLIEVLVEEALGAGLRTPEWHALTRPAWGAVEAVTRVCALAAEALSSVYIVHMNTGGEVDQLQYFRQRGLPMMGETCPQYLFFTIEQLRRPDGDKWVCSPPLRSEEDNQRLWEGLRDGIIQTIATDHCPFFYNGKQAIEYEGKKVAIPGKELGSANFSLIPNGLPGVGDRLPILWTYGVRAGRISANQFVNLNCTNPAKIFGLYPQKGTLLPGSDADIVIWDSDCTVTYGVNVAQHRTDYNLYENWQLIGFPKKVFLRGKLIVDDGQWLGKAGKGQFIYRKPFAAIL